LAREQIARVAPACQTVALDIGTTEGPARLIHCAISRFGRVDVLCNNAGIAPRATLEGLTDGDLEQALAVNVEAVFRTTRAVWPLLRQQGDGVIINISSLASLDPFPGFSLYGACKSWVNLFTKAVADEGRALGIRVYAVALGAVETRMLRGLFPDFPAAQTLSPDEVAQFIGSLLTEPMRYASGQTIALRK
jgi:NAD(P)-dependent dehydrogenase (short-subunit alcohol dehydrogenase family)